MSEDTQTLLAQESAPLAKLPHEVIPHGLYKTYQNLTPDSDLPPRPRVLGHVGVLSRYKGTLELIHAFRDLPDPTAALLVAGECKDADLLTELQTSAAADGRIQLRLGRLTDREYASAISSAHAIVLPYRQILNSGSVIAALSLGTKVIVPNMGSMQDLARRVGPGWVTLYEPPLASAHLADVLTDRPTEPADLSSFDWSAIAQQHISMYESSMQTKAPPRRSSAQARAHGGDL